jgi:hypothetical protein
MSSRWLAAVAIGLFFSVDLNAAPVNNAAGAAEPALVVRVQPMERLLADAKFVAGRVGGLAAIQKLDAAINELFGDNGLTGSGIDPSKPFGLYGVARPEFSAGCFVVLIPVADEKATLALLDRFEIKAERMADGQYTLTCESLPVPLFLRFANGYAYVVADDRDALTPEKLVAPGRVFAGDEPALLSAVLNFDRVPELVRKRAAFQLTVLNGVTSFASFGGADNENGMDLSQLRAAMRWASQILTDAREVSLRVAFDRKSGELSVEAGGAGRANTPLAKTIAAMPATRSLFPGLIRPDAAANALVCSPLVDEMRQSLVRAFGNGADGILQEFDVDEEAQPAAKALLKALVPTIQAGLFDAALSMRGPTKDKYSLIGGLRLKDGRKVENAVLAALKTLPDDQKKNQKFNAFKVGDVAVHQYQLVEPDEDDETTMIFGSQPLYFAFRDDSVLAAYGPDGRKLLEEALRSIREEPAASAMIDFSVKRMTKALEPIAEEIPDWLAKAAGEGIDRVRLLHITVDGGPKFVARYAFNLQFVWGMVSAFDDDDSVPAVPVQPPPAPAPPPPAAPVPPPPNSR